MTNPSNTEIREDHEILRSKLFHDPVSVESKPILERSIIPLHNHRGILLDRLEASEARLTAEAELNGLARKSLCKELAAAEAKLKAIGELIPSPAETWSYNLPVIDAAEIEAILKETQ